MGTDGDLRSDRVLGRETGMIKDHRKAQAARSKTCTGGRIAAKNNLGLTEQAVVKVNLAGHEKNFLSCYRFCLARFGHLRHVPARPSDHAFPFVGQRDVFAQLRKMGKLASKP